MCLLSQLLSKVGLHILQFLHQMFNVSALLLDDAAGDATDQWRVQWNAATVCLTQWRHTWGVVRFLVIVLLQIFSWFWERNNFKNRLIFDKVKRYKTVVSIFRGPPCIPQRTLQATIASASKQWGYTCNNHPRKTVRSVSSLYVARTS